MILTKTQSVMRRFGESSVSVTYSNGSTEPGDYTTRMLTVDRQTYDDLGQPFEVTITIEPDDQLSDKEATDE